MTPQYIKKLKALVKKADQSRMAAKSTDLVSIAGFTADFAYLLGFIEALPDNEEKV